MMSRRRRRCGAATLDGLTAVRVNSSVELREGLNAGDVLPVSTAPFGDVLDAVSWSVIVDPRMRKRAVPEVQRGLAPMTIGLGPNFVAGETVDLAIETMWGDQLGAIIETGATLPLAGEPRPIGGVGRARFVYARQRPAASSLVRVLAIGSRKVLSSRP
jgi:xanthine dehydrogenase accessory factor